MTKTTRWWCVNAVVIGAAVAVMAGSNRAQDTKEPDKQKEKMLSDALKDVINTGAKMFNEQGDHAGCYRLYQGSLLAVKPFVSPELQKRIDDGMNSAERLSAYSERAFELRKVLDEIRASANPAGKIGDKKDDVKDKKDDVKDKKDDVKDKKDDVKDKKDDVKDKKDDVKDKKDDVKDKKEEKKIESIDKKRPVNDPFAIEGRAMTGGNSVTVIVNEKNGSIARSRL
jgi:hypothetical protein